MQGRVIVEVEDSGEGVVAENVNRIFDPWFTTKGSGGTGIGLFIVQQILECHGGTVGIRDRSGAQGSCFYLSLPLFGKTVGITKKRLGHVIPSS
jgi:signal transduction histidine kinase